MDPVAIVRSYLDALNARDPDLIASHVSDDFENEHTASNRLSLAGRRAYRERLDHFLAGFPRLEYSEEDILADGERVVVAYRLSADRVDENDGSVKPIEVRGVFRFRVQDGAIAHRVDYFDGVTVEMQMGRRS